MARQHHMGQTRQQRTVGQALQDRIEHIERRQRRRPVGRFAL
jgi:hypothetical protein